MKMFWRSAVLVAAIWMAAFLLIRISRSAAPTPEKIRVYLAAHPAGSLSGPQRAELIESVAAQLNRLDVEQRRELHESGTMRRFFEELTPAERSRFLSLTLPEGFRQMISALNKMEPAKRQRLVQRALDNIRNNAPRSAERIDETEVKKIVSEGVSSFYENANADVKLDFAPVLEELQKNIQSLR